MKKITALASLMGLIALPIMAQDLDVFVNSELPGLVDTYIIPNEVKMELTTRAYSDPALTARVKAALIQALGAQNVVDEEPGRGRTTAASSACPNPRCVPGLRR